MTQAITKYSALPVAEQPIVVRGPDKPDGPNTSIDRVINSIYASIGFSQGEAAISGLSINHGFTVANWTWFQRTLSDLVGAIQADNSNKIVEAVFNIISTPGGLALYQAFGLPSATYSWTAILQMAEDIRIAEYAGKIGDLKGKYLQLATLIQDATLAAGGLSFLGYRATAIASAVTGVSPSGFTAPTALGRVTYAFVFVGIIFFTLCYLILSAVLGVKIIQSRNFRKKLENSINGADGIKAVQNQMEFLRSRLEPNRGKIGEKLAKKYDGDPTRIHEDMVNEVVNYGTEILEKQLESADLKKTKTQIRKFLLDNISVENMYELGMAIKMRKQALKKEAKLARLTSQECVNLIKTATTEAEQKAALEKVNKALVNNESTYKQVIAACMAGAIFMIAGLIISTGVGAIIIAVAMVLVALAMIKLDSDSLKDSIATEAPKKWDKTLVKISMALCVASLAIVTGLVIAGLIVASPYVIVMSAILSLIWLAYSLKTLNAINAKEEQFKIDHPTLDMLLEALRNNAGSKEIDQMVDKLPLVEQSIFRKEFFASEARDRQAAITAALETMQKIADFNKIRQGQLAIDLLEIK